jgi:hypothetical protein
MLPDPAVRPLITVDEFVACAGGRLRRTAVYDACRRGEIPSRRIGRKLLIPTAAAWRLFDLDPTGRDEGGGTTDHPASVD